MAKKTGLYLGGETTSHASGNDIPVIVDGTKQIRVEGNEYLLCHTIFENTDTFSFTKKTNKQILNHFHGIGHCRYEKNKATSGDFIICKLAVTDKTKRTVSGTIREIVDAMQKAHGGR